MFFGWLAVQVELWKLVTSLHLACSAVTFRRLHTSRTPNSWNKMTRVLPSYDPNAYDDHPSAIIQALGRGWGIWTFQG